MGRLHVWFWWWYGKKRTIHSYKYFPFLCKPAQATAESSTPLGNGAQATGVYSTALGLGANANIYTSLVLNAGSTPLLASGPGFFVNPVRSFAGSANLAYNSASNEIYVASSSRRYKTDIQEVSSSESARVWDLRPVSYRDIHAANDDNSPVYYVFIAEEVAEVDPRLCFWGLDADGLPQVEGVNYDQIVPLLLQEAKQLKVETVALKAARVHGIAEIAAFKSAREKDSAEIAALHARNVEMEKKMELLFAEFQKLVVVGQNRS